MKTWIAFVTGALLLSQSTIGYSCCAVSRAVDQIINADQTVIILWDAETQTQHFIRKATFKGDGDAKDFGFIVPSPTQPELAESGDSAFSTLKFLTAPVVKSPPSFSIGCSKSAAPQYAAEAVEVLEEKRVAGFDAVVLKAETAEALVDWLAKNDYAYSDAVADWARPYVERGWPFTALKIAKPNPDETLDNSTTEADTLRISFKTDKPLFPYREPESATAAKNLDVEDRLLRIYFIADKAFAGAFENGEKWSGKKVWSGNINDYNRTKLLSQLDLPETAGPENWWLTEFEDNWAYEKAPGDVYFMPDSNKKPLKRTALVIPSDPLPLTALLLLLGLSLRRRFVLKED